MLEANGSIMDQLIEIGSFENGTRTNAMHMEVVLAVVMLWFVNKCFLSFIS